MTTCSGVKFKWKALGFRWQDGQESPKGPSEGPTEDAPNDSGGAQRDLRKAGLVHTCNLQNCDPCGQPSPYVDMLGTYIHVYICTRMRKGMLLVLRDEGETGTTRHITPHILPTPIPISARLDLNPKKEVVGQSMR